MSAKHRPVLRMQKCENSLAYFDLGLFFLPFVAFGFAEFGALVFFGLIVMALFTVAVVCRHQERSYRLRILRNGIRITEWGVSRNYLEPQILNPLRIGKHPLKLKANDVEVEIVLEHFSRRDRAILVEHLSQFLTTEQQAICGDVWALCYAQLITTEKPVDRLPDYLQLWKLLCQAAAAGILLSPMLFAMIWPHCPAGVLPWEIPGIRQIFYLELYISVSLLFIVPAMVGILIGCSHAAMWLYKQLESSLDKAHLETRWMLSRVRRLIPKN